MIEEEEEGIQIVCPYCGKVILLPPGYNRPTYLCPKCKKPVPIDEDLLVRLSNM